MTTQIISSNLELHGLSTGRLPRVATANRMLKQMLFRYGHQYHVICLCVSWHKLKMTFGVQVILGQITVPTVMLGAFNAYHLLHTLVC